MIELQTGANEMTFRMISEGQEEADWTITVIAEDTGRPLPRVQATLGQMHTYTNPYGVAVFVGITKGTYRFSLSKQGYEPITDTVVYNP